MTEDLFPVPHEPTSRALAPVEYLPRLFEIAVSKGPEGVEALRQLVALQQQIEDRQAAREFAAAFAAFQASCPRIPRESVGKIVTTSGASYEYSYSSLDEIERVIRPHLAANGFSYSFDPEVVDANNVASTCVLLHSSGHFQRARIAVSTEVTTKMSAQHRTGSADSYARRRALISVCGLVSCDPDDDAAEPEQSAPITPEQVLVLEELLGRCPDGTRRRFLAWAGVETLEGIRASRFEACKAKLEEKAQ